MTQLPQNVSESTRRRNPTLYGGPQTQGFAPRSDLEPTEGVKTPRRLKQRVKPLLNALEQEWFDYAQPRFHERIMVQSVGFRLGNGVVYWPDAVSESFTHFWEIKGRRQIQDDSAVKIKVAARLYPKIQWILVWKDGVNWRNQSILP